MACRGELRKHFGQIAIDVFWEREEALILGDGHGSQLARPVVDVAEGPAVKRLEMREVVAPGQSLVRQLGQDDRRLLGFEPFQLIGIEDAGPVAQAACAWVHVRVAWQRGLRCARVGEQLLGRQRSVAQEPKPRLLKLLVG